MGIQLQKFVTTLCQYITLNSYICYGHNERWSTFLGNYILASGLSLKRTRLILDSLPNRFTDISINKANMKDIPYTLNNYYTNLSTDQQPTSFIVKITLYKFKR
ncbi:hypothetical protein H8356DRAFT_1355991 [Neocallimastix lanati (nom. inval.)]|nr:hypothetical protein H8356DRAFT_1355991 [Neocallimastix sp. JGI-2020a]